MQKKKYYLISLVSFISLVATCSKLDQYTGTGPEILENIVGSARKVEQLIDEVSSASSEQSQGIDQVNAAVAQSSERQHQAGRRLDADQQVGGGCWA